MLRKYYQAESYKWIAGTLKRFDYFKLSKKDKGTVRAYIARITEYSRAQLNRLIQQYKKKHWIGEKCQHRNCFANRYTSADILLLAETDECHQTLVVQLLKSFLTGGKQKWLYCKEMVWLLLYSAKACYVN